LGKKKDYGCGYLKVLGHGRRTVIEKFIGLYFLVKFGRK
jgi:hypothetical protein